MRTEHVQTPFSLSAGRNGPQRRRSLLHQLRLLVHLHPLLFTPFALSSSSSSSSSFSLLTLLTLSLLSASPCVTRFCLQGGHLGARLPRALHRGRRRWFLRLLQRHLDGDPHGGGCPRTRQELQPHHLSHRGIPVLQPALLIHS